MSTKENLAGRIEHLAQGELILACTLAAGNFGGYEWESSEVETACLSWADARPLLDWEYEDFGWDGPRAPWLMAWTDSWVIFTHDYDTATTLYRLPRNPTHVIGTSAVGAQ